jgi:hypothetical protein
MIIGIRPRSVFNLTPSISGNGAKKRTTLPAAVFAD